MPTEALLPITTLVLSATAIALIHLGAVMLLWNASKLAMMACTATRVALAYRDLGYRAR